MQQLLFCFRQLADLQPYCLGNKHHANIVQIDRSFQLNRIDRLAGNLIRIKRKLQQALGAPLEQWRTHFELLRQHAEKPQISRHLLPATSNGRSTWLDRDFHMGRTKSSHGLNECDSLRIKILTGDIRASLQAADQLNELQVCQRTICNQSFDGQLQSIHSQQDHFSEQGRKFDFTASQTGQ